MAGPCVYFGIFLFLAALLWPRGFHVFVEECYGEALGSAAGKG